MGDIPGVVLASFNAMAFTQDSFGY
jgi:hypothetical protein